MARYRKKPVEIEAMQWDGTMDRAQEIAEWSVHEVWYLVEQREPRTPPEFLFVDTPEGRRRAGPGDWIIRDVKGEYYLCKPEIFAATYDEAI